MSVHVMSFIMEMRNAGPHADRVKLEDAPSMSGLKFDQQVELKALGSVAERTLDITAIEAEEVLATKLYSLSITFTLPSSSGGPDASSGATLRAPSARRVQWADGIVTLAIPEGNSFPMVLRAKLHAHAHEEGHEDGKGELLGELEVTLEVPSGRAFHVPLLKPKAARAKPKSELDLIADGGEDGEVEDEMLGSTISFSHVPSTIVHRDAGKSVLQE